MSLLNMIVILLLSFPLGLGIGGGGLFLIYLTDAVGIPNESAVYLNLIFFLSALLAATANHLRARRLSFPLLGSILLFGVPGALLGRAASMLLPLSIRRILLGCFLIVSGVLSLTSLKKQKDNPNALDKP